MSLTDSNYSWFSGSVNSDANWNFPLLPSQQHSCKLWDCLSLLSSVCLCQLCIWLLIAIQKRRPDQQMSACERSASFLLSSNVWSNWNILCVVFIYLPTAQRIECVVCAFFVYCDQCWRSHLMSASTSKRAQFCPFYFVSSVLPSPPNECSVRMFDTSGSRLSGAGPSDGLSRTSSFPAPTVSSRLLIKMQARHPSHPLLHGLCLTTWNTFWISTLLNLLFLYSSTPAFYQLSLTDRFSFFSLLVTEKPYKVKLKFKRKMAKHVYFEVLQIGR